jgi:hypothetical protein
MRQLEALLEGLVPGQPTRAANKRLPLIMQVSCMLVFAINLASPGTRPPSFFTHFLDVTSRSDPS